MFNLQSNHKGTTLLLSLLILTTLLLVSLAMSGMVMREKKVVEKLGASEIALLASESGIEKALYEIETSKSKLLPDLVGTQGGLDNGSSWKLSQVLVDTENPFVPGEITTDNPLEVSLDGGESFGLSLDMRIDFSTYLNKIEISWLVGAQGKVVTLEWSREGAWSPTQEIFTSSPVKIPSTGNLLNTKYYKFRINNPPTSPTTTYTIKPIGGELPVGVIIKSEGQYQDLKRILKTREAKWQRY